MEGRQMDPHSVRANPPRSLRTRAVIGASVLILVPAAAAVAFKRTGGTDPAGDVANPAYDIRGASAVRTRQGRVRHVVTLLDANRSSEIMTRIDIRAAGRRYVADTSGGTVYKLGSFEKTGNAKVKRKRNDVIIAYRLRAIGEPGRIKWQALVGAGDSADVAPDYGRVSTRVR